MRRGKILSDEEKNEKITKLPVWAQDEIFGLRRTVEEKTRRIVELVEGDPEADTFADPYHDESHGGTRPLGRGALIRFGGKDHDDTFDVRLEDGILRVQGNSTYPKEMALLLSHSNVVNVAFVPRVR